MLLTRHFQWAPLCGRTALSIVINFIEEQTLRRHGHPGIAPDPAFEDGVDIFRLHRPRPDFQQRPHHDPDHIVKEAFTYERKVQQIAFLLDRDFVDGPDRRFF